MHIKLLRKLWYTRKKERTPWLGQTSGELSVLTLRFLRDPQYLGAGGREGEDLLQFYRSLQEEVQKMDKTCPLYTLLKQYLRKPGFCRGFG